MINTKKADIVESKLVQIIIILVFLAVIVFVYIAFKDEIKKIIDIFL